MNKIEGTPFIEAAQSFQNEIKGKFHTILADPPYAKKSIMQSNHL